MGNSYGKLTRGHEEVIYEMKKARKTGREMKRALAEGANGEPPVSVSVDRCLKVARRILDEREELYDTSIQDKPAPEGLRILTRKLMLIAERETARLERAERAGRLDANRLGKLAGAVTKLHVLLERNEELGGGSEPPKKGEDRPAVPDDAPSSFASGLLNGGEPVADVPVSNAAQ